MKSLVSNIALAAALLAALGLSGRIFHRTFAETMPTKELEQPSAALTTRQLLRKLPLSFEVNKGQTNARVKFLSRGPGYTLFLTPNGAVLSLVKPAYHMGVAGLSRSPSASGRHLGVLPLHLTVMNPLANLFSPIGQVPKTRLRRSSAVRASVVQVRLTDANSHARVVGMDKQPGVSNYFIGNNPLKWRTHVPTYERVKYQNVYPGIDLVYYGNQGRLEYDFVVHPGASPNAIRLAVTASAAAGPGSRTSSARIAANGDLVIPTNAGEVRFYKPVVYQWQPPRNHSDSRQRTYVAGHYTLGKDGKVGFVVPRYNSRLPLIIDPILNYSTYLGGGDWDSVNALTVDASGYVYVCGTTASTDFPVTSGAFQTSLKATLKVYSFWGGGPTNTFVAKINPSGTALAWATYLGGSGEEMYGALGITVDSSGDVYVTGQTDSTDFPVTSGAFETVNGAAGQYTSGSGEGDAFVTKLNPTGSSLVYSTFLGGTTSESHGQAIAVDASGDAYVTGDTQATDFPATPGAFQSTDGGGALGNCGATYPSTLDGFVAKLNPTGTGLIYASYLGGNGDDDIQAIAVDSSGDAYVAGGTISGNFPTTPGAFEGATGSCGGFDGFVAKVNPTGTGLIYATEIRGQSIPTPTSVGSGVSSLALDSSGNAYVTGGTSTTDFPTTAGAFQTVLKGSHDAFVAEVNPTGTGLVYSTYLGGTGSNQSGEGIALDQSGDTYIMGNTNASDFPVTAGAPQSSFGGGGSDVFISELNPTGTGLIFSTYLGGTGVDGAQHGDLALDGAGGIYVGGYTTSADFPVTTGALQTTHAYQSGASQNADSDGFVAKISSTASQPPVANAGANQTVECQSNFSATVTLDGSASSDPDGEALTYKWTDAAGDVLGTTAKINVTAPLTAPGPTTTTYTLTVTDSGGLSSTANTSVTVQDTTPPTLTLSQTAVTAVLPTASASGVDTSTLNLNQYASATDVCDPNPTISNNAPSVLPIGITQVTFTATDHCNNVSTTQTLTVQVTYNFNGYFTPVLNNGSSLFKSGRTVPVKFQLTAADGSIITNATAQLHVAMYSGAVIGTNDMTDATASGNSDTGNQFRFDPTSEQYVYNLSTSGFTTGTWLLRATLNDGTTHDVLISLR